MSLVETLIDRASKNVGSSAELARLLGVPRSKITQWKNGHTRCQPDDMAAIAVYAGFNALNVLALATLEHAKGTPKEKVLQDGLGESLPALVDMHRAGLSDENGLKARVLQCILC